MGLIVLQPKMTSSPCPCPNLPRKTSPGTGEIGKGFLFLGLKTLKMISQALGPNKERVAIALLPGGVNRARYVALRGLTIGGFLN
jgi:hypothetical protein